MMKLTENKSSLLHSPLASKSVVDRIVDRITGAIISGELRPGDKIPTEVELCESLQVGRNSVREAIKVLVSFGVVHIKRSEGTYVCDSFDHRMLDPMLYGLILENDQSSSLLELRQIFDTGILQLVVDKAKPEDIAHIRRALFVLEQEIRRPDAEARRSLEADVRFHRVIAESVHNKLVLNIAMYIDRMTIPSRTRTQEQILKNGGRERYIELHREILSIIENKDLQKIGKVVESHYTFWRKAI